MSKALLIDSRVSESQCEKAVDALHDWASKKASKDAENQLLPGKEPTIWLCVALKQSPSGMSFKPVRIPLVHPLVDPRTNGVCLLTKDPQRKYKDLLESHNIKFISRVISLEKLKGKFKPFEARRVLLRENGLFLADQSILPLLPKLLGVKWFEAKKQPIPVCLTRKDLKSELERAISSTYMNQNKGTAVSIKIGTLSQNPSQILANLKSAIPAVAGHMKGGAGGWENMQSLGIKTNNSAHLPIWSCALDDSEGGRWAGLTALEVEDEDEVEMDGSEEEEGEEESFTSEKLSKSSGTKKRVVEDDDEDAQKSGKPKKAKSHEFSTPVTSKKRKAAEESEPVDNIPHVPTDKKVTKKKRKSDAGVVSVPVDDPTPATLATIESKPKKKKAKQAEAVVDPSSQPKKSNIQSEPVDNIPHVPIDKKVTKKKRKSDAGAVSAPVDDPTPATPATIESKPKKKKAKQAEAVVEPSSQPKKSNIQVTAVAVEAPVDDSTPSQSQKAKKKKVRGSVEDVPDLVDVDRSKTEDKKRKKGQESISTRDSPAPTDSVTVLAPVADKIVSVSASTKRSKRKLIVGDVEETKELAVSETSEGEKKQKKVKKSGVEVMAPPTLSEEEIKQKKAARGAGEKKKEKVIKSKGGKSAKDILLGKKAG